jgi:hypothetical protein
MDDMHKTLAWLRQNALIPGVMIGLTTIVAAVFQMREIDGRQYRSMRMAFKDGPHAFKAATADAMSDGHISRWEYTGLVRVALDENRAIVISMDKFNVAEERVVLSAMVKQVRR